MNGREPLINDGYQAEIVLIFDREYILPGCMFSIIEGPYVRAFTVAYIRAESGTDTKLMLN